MSYDGLRSRGRYDDPWLVLIKIDKTRLGKVAWMIDVSVFSVPAHIGQAFVVVSHEVDGDTRFKMQAAESSFSHIVNGEVKSTNVPASASPEVPRFQLGNGFPQILISNNRIQLAFDFAGLSIDKALDVLRKKVGLFFKGVTEFNSPRLNRFRLGVVIHFHQPTTASRAEIANYFAKNFYAGPQFGLMNALEAKISFDVGGGLYQNFAFSVYETKELKFDKPTSITEVVVRNLDDLPVAETGISSVVDVNTGAEFLNGDPERVLFDKKCSEILDQLSAAVANSQKLVELRLTA